MASNRDDSLDGIFDDVKEAIGPLDDVDQAFGGKAAQGPGAASSPSDAHSTRSASALRASVDATTFPTEMNCSQVFDQLLKCYSLGGQIRNYYRYGEISYCQEKRKQLKFCLSTRLVGEEERKDQIKKWYMTALAEQQSHGQSSEAVWSSRAVPLRRPFREDSEQFLNEHSN